MLLKKDEVVGMFQNIQEEIKSQEKEETVTKKNILANVISKKYILLYLTVFMVSTIGLGQAMSPFAIAMIVAIISNEIPVVAALAIGLIGNIIGCGAGSILYYVVTLLIFFATFFVVEPKYNDESRNEKVKLGGRIFVASLIVGIVKVFISGFLLYDLLVAIVNSMLIYVLYKIFANSITVITDFSKTKAFTLEEIMGASVLLTIAVCAIGDFSILGFSLRNIIAIFIILVLGWKNGMLVGTTAGVTIGVTLGIITGSEPVTIAAYAISGLVAGVLNRFGKIGVIVGFVLGDILLTYLQNGGIENLIIFQEILIAGIGLLAVPKNIKLNIEDIIGKEKFLPDGVNRGLNRSQETVEKLKNVSKAIKDMADTYNNVSDESLSVEDINKKNKQTFIAELLNYTENMEDNILYDNISDVDGKIVDDIFNKLLESQFIKEKDLLRIFAKNNNYIVGFKDDEKTVNRDVEKMTRVINAAYRISKMNFIWDRRLKEEKTNMQTQLNGVSKAIQDIADDIKIEIKTNELYSDEKEQISLLLKQKSILVQEISINKKDDGRFIIEIYIEETEQDDVKESISNIIEKTLNEKVKLTESTDIESEKCEKYIFVSDDKFLIEMGQAIAIKDNMPVSGDSILQTKLKDGKYLFAISDGMGSGANARKSSQIVVKMLQRLLNSGFSKDVSVDLINSNLLNVGDDVFATLDIAIVDLYNGSIEFIKSGCSPTYIKNKRRIQLIKSISLPTGAIKDSTQEVFDKDIDSGDTIVMCSDGIIDSNIEYKNKELWVKYLLEDIEIDNPQKIADIILQESIDNNFGKIKDDMSIITFKLTRK
jgi:stage II sporulation protein E